MAHKRPLQSIPDEPEQSHGYEQEQETVNQACNSINANIEAIRQLLLTGSW
jgi:hypothetical protein